VVGQELEKGNMAQKKVEKKPPVVWREFTEVKPHPDNPRLHSDDQIERLAHSQAVLEDYAVDGDGKISISYQKSTSFLLTGHGLVEAKKLRGKMGAWMYELDVPDDVAKAWMIRDNQLGDLSIWDNVKLEGLTVELQEMPDFEMKDTGFEAEELEQIIQKWSPDETGFPDIPSGDKSPFQQMTFTLADSQAETVKEAISAAKAAGAFIETGNENSNGNALARIAEAYLGAS